MTGLRNILGAVGRALGDYVFPIFQQESVAIGLALLLLLSGVLFVLWLVLFKWVPFSKTLRRLEASVESASDEPEFTKNFATIDDSFRERKNRQPRLGGVQGNADIPRLRFC